MPDDLESTLHRSNTQPTTTRPQTEPKEEKKYAFARQETNRISNKTTSNNKASTTGSATSIIDNTNTYTSTPTISASPLFEETVTCSASAPGKVILFGEHAVVYSQPAVAASLSNLRVKTTVQTRNDGLIIVHMPDIPLHVEFEAEKFKLQGHKKNGEEIRHFIEMEVMNMNENKFSNNNNPKLSNTKSEPGTAAFMALVPLLHLVQSIVPIVLSKDVGLSVYIASGDLPVGAGLGSSAAFSVSTSAALLQLCECLTTSEREKQQRLPTPGELDLINQYAYMSEQLIHGSPSGIDNTISCFGGAIYFQREPNLTREAIQDFPQRSLFILLTHTTVPRSTKILVSKVKDKYNDFPLVINGIFQAIGGISRMFYQLVQKSTLTHTRLSFLVQTNQLLLQSLGVSHASIQDVCSFTQQYGVASKLTGAGGGGCVVSFLPDQECGYELKRAIERHFQLPCWITSIGGEGVRFEDVNQDDEDSMHVLMRRKNKLARDGFFIIFSYARKSLVGVAAATFFGIGFVWSYNCSKRRK